MPIKLTIAIIISIVLALLATANIVLDFHFFGSPLDSADHSILCIYTEKLIYSFLAIFFAILAVGLLSLK
ncbi:hypothetical protein GCM10023338_12820 [Wohlfahrtiimonas larvae]|uniref:Uncharacterized protein n=1 Tax=Wohlfahrtiimonas larvae TaxID=1157986 RepID=A0ABP9MQ28_9GAMM